MGMVYQWKDAGITPQVPAQIAGEEMERIRVHNNGRLESRMLVEVSKPKDAPLHKAFEWNDKKAAEMWRVEQAGFMIRHITVSVEKPDGEAKPTRAFVSVVRDEDRSYTSIEHALSDAALRAQVVAQAWSELEAWHKRHAELVEFARVFTAIEQARPAK